MLNRTTFRTHGIRTSLICIALAVLALMASGCALNPSAKDTGLPKTVVVAQGTDATSMDPARRVGFPSLNINMHISDPLVFGDPEKGIVPWLAESWSNPDDTTWVFNLRKGVKFHNGEPFNAEAAAYSLERFRDRDIPGLKHAYYWDICTIVSAEAADEYTLVIKTEKPSALVLPVLTQVEMIAPKWAQEAGLDETNKKLIGTGPFKFVEWVKDDHVTLEANKDYWGGKPLVDKLIFRPIPDAGTRIAELLSGGVHVALDIPLDQAGKVETDTTTLATTIGRRAMYIGIVNNKPDLPTYDKRVRQAMNYAVDVDTITETLMQGYTRPYAGLIAPPYNDPDIEPYPYDPDKARELLKAAGYENGFSVTIDSPNGRYMKDVEVAQAVAQYLNDVGIKATVQTYDWGTYNDRLQNATTSELYLMGQALPSPFEQLSTLLDSRSAGIAAHGYANEEFFALMDKAATLLNEDEYLATLYEAQDIVWDDAPMIFMYHQPVAWGASTRLEGFTAASSDELRLHKVLLKQNDK
ncbi:MAG: ABC transporter substrate-binding protein [Bacillota bacterium]|jgi:peptide/nickel transport system substrate-binding protein